jgi:uncharacterized protein (TIGR03437 family)
VFPVTANAPQPCLGGSHDIVVGVAYTNGDAQFELGGVQVFFDGRPAPMIYAQSRQINAIAPVELSGKSTSILVQYSGVPYGPVSADVSFAAPELFRLKPGVATQAAAINADGTVNGPANRAPHGSVITMYGSGLGAIERPCTNGVLNAGASPLRADLVISSAFLIAPDTTRVLYAGAAPGLLCGVQQINFRLPDSVSGPAVRIGFQAQSSLTTGLQTSTEGVTIAVQ